MQFIIKNIIKADLYKNNVLNKFNKKYNKTNNLLLKHFIINLINKYNLGSISNIKIINYRYSYSVICNFNKLYIPNNNTDLLPIISNNNSITIFSNNIYFTIYYLDSIKLNKCSLKKNIFTCFR